MEYNIKSMAQAISLVDNPPINEVDGVCGECNRPLRMGEITHPWYCTTCGVFLKDEQVTTDEKCPFCKKEALSVGGAPINNYGPPKYNE